MKMVIKKIAERLTYESIYIKKIFGMHGKECIEFWENFFLKILICLVLTWHLSNNSITIFSSLHFQWYYFSSFNNWQTYSNFVILFNISLKLLRDGDFVSSIYLFIIKANHNIH